MSCNLLIWYISVVLDTDFEWIENSTLVQVIVKKLRSFNTIDEIRRLYNTHLVKERKCSISHVSKDATDLGYMLNTFALKGFEEIS